MACEQDAQKVLWQMKRLFTALVGSMKEESNEEDVRASYHSIKKALRASLRHIANMDKRLKARE